MMMKIQAKISFILQVFWTYIIKASKQESYQHNSSGECLYLNYEQTMKQRLAHRGKKETCRQYKELHLVAQRIALGLPFTPVM
jgi:hypothetical protein